MTLFQLSFLFFLLIPAWGIASDQCSELGNGLFGLSGKILQSAQVQYAKRDMKDFCRRNMLLRFLNTHKNTDTYAEYDTLSTDQLGKLAASRADFEDPWQLSLLPTTETREKALKLNRQHTNVTLSADHMEMTDDELQTYLSKPEPRPDDDVKDAKLCWNKNANTSSEAAETMNVSAKALNAAKWAACVKNGIMISFNCKKGLDILQKRLAPVQIDTALTRPDLFEKVLGSKSYEDGVRRAALKLLDRVRNRKQDNGSIFDDLKSSFEDSSMSKMAAEDAAWDILALISTSGPNILYRINNCANRSIVQKDIQIHIALGYIAAAIPLLDLRRSNASQHLYSFPANVKVQCDTGKTYHFWMSAYSARELVLVDKLPVDAANSSTYVAEQGYQALRGLISGKKNKVGENNYNGVLKHKTFSPVMNVAMPQV